MHLRSAGLAGWIFLCAVAARSEDSFPYTAYVAADDAVCRSGPGERYYASARLTRGQLVEVYRHDEGQWCAIRPPEGSFSWLAEGHVQPLGDGLGEVVGDDAITHVGSTVTGQRDVQQVRLDEGEVIEILDRQTEGQGDDSEVWYKIAPPAGEFRWVAAADLSREPSGGLARDTRRNLLIDEPTMTPLSSNAEAGTSIAERADAESAAQNVPPPAAGWKADRRPAEARRQPTSMIAEPPVAEVVAEELDAIELFISRTVAAEPATWSFDRAKQRAETAKDRATATADRSRARSLLRRIKRFEDIQQRANALVTDSTGVKPAEAATAEADVTIDGGNASESPTRNAPEVATVDSPPTQPRAPHVAANDRFDGLGRLTRVVSQQMGMPQYALVDEQGNVKHYVSPAPGVNLRRYLGHQVGVNGQRGFIPELNAEHVTARRITTMDSGRLLR
jgi:hypothetical protein